MASRAPSVASWISWSASMSTFVKPGPKEDCPSVKQRSGGPPGSSHGSSVSDWCRSPCRGRVARVDEHGQDDEGEQD